DARRVDVGDLAEVENQAARIVGAYDGLELEEVEDGNWPGKADNAFSLRCSGEIFDAQRVLWHPHIVLRECEYCVKERQLARWKSDKVTKFQRPEILCVFRVTRDSRSKRNEVTVFHFVTLPCYFTAQP